MQHSSHNALLQSHVQRSVGIERPVNILLIFGILEKQLMKKEFLMKFLVVQECELFLTTLLCPECEIGLRKFLRQKVSQNYLLKPCALTPHL